MTTARVNTATKADENRVVDVITLAFSTEPTARYTCPTAPVYVAYWPEIVKAFSSQAFDRGTAFYVDDFLGAALWLRPDVHPDEEKLVALLQRTIPEENQEDAFAVLEQMGNSHPGEAHWYLPLIGVDPVYQRKGYGSVLMQHALALIDGDHKPAYLDCSDPASIPFYEQHGFEVLREIQIGTSPSIYPMLRQPR